MLTGQKLEETARIINFPLLRLTRNYVDKGNIMEKAIWHWDKLSLALMNMH